MGPLVRGPPGIGYNLTDDFDYIGRHKLVHLKSSRESNDAINLQYITYELN